jgi:hypothetical protein
MNDMISSIHEIFTATVILPSYCSAEPTSSRDPGL